MLEERNRLASEIHDSLAQSFTGISMQLVAAQEVIKAGDYQGLNYVKRANDLARFGLSEARRSTLGLRSNVIGESGLIEALKMLVERTNIPGLLRCSFRCSHVREERVAPEVQQDLLRIAQEAISNALRHARPTTISVSLRWDPPNLKLQVKDNGAGISRACLEKRDGFGLGSMRDRAAQIDAKLEIQTAAGHGTSIIVTVPLMFTKKAPNSHGFGNLRP